MTRVDSRPVAGPAEAAQAPVLWPNGNSQDSGPRTWIPNRRALVIEARKRWAPQFGETAKSI